METNPSEGLPASQSGADKELMTIEPPATNEQQAQVEVGSQLPEFLVRFEDGEAANPKNFNTFYKAWVTFVLGLQAFAGAVGSAIVTPAEEAVAAHFGVSQEATTLLLALYLLGMPMTYSHPCLHLD
jgi:hypothetical protein